MWGGSWWGRSLDKCHHDITETPEGVTVTIKTFTRHENPSAELDPVTMTEYSHKGESVCHYSALDPKQPVTKVCFPKVGSAEHTVEVLEKMTMKKVYEGLAPGKSSDAVAIFGNRGCGYFPGSTATPKMSDNVNPICVHSQVNPYDIVTKICFDPSDPGRMTVDKGDPSVFKDRGGIEGPRAKVFIPEPKIHVSLPQAIRNALWSWWEDIPLQPMDTKMKYIVKEVVGNKEDL